MGDLPNIRRRAISTVVSIQLMPTVIRPPMSYQVAMPALWNGQSVEMRYWILSRSRWYSAWHPIQWGDALWNGQSTWGLDSLSWGADTRVDSKMFSCLFIITITFSWHFLFHSHQRFLRCATPAGTRCSFVSPQHFLPLLHFTFTFSPFFISTLPPSFAFHFHFFTFFT